MCTRCVWKRFSLHINISKKINLNCTINVGNKGLTIKITDSIINITEIKLTLKLLSSLAKHMIKEITVGYAVIRFNLTKSKHLE